MAKQHGTSVEELYSMRVRPRSGYTMDDGASEPIRRSPPVESASARDTAHNYHDNQAPEDRHGPGYSNDVSDDWRRGGGAGGATGKPSFDKQGAWRQPDGSIHSAPGELGQQRRPEPVTANRRQMKDGG